MAGARSSFAAMLRGRDPVPPAAVTLSPPSQGQRRRDLLQVQSPCYCTLQAVLSPLPLHELQFHPPFQPPPLRHSRRGQNDFGRRPPHTHWPSRGVAGDLCVALAVLAVVARGSVKVGARELWSWSKCTPAWERCLESRENRKQRCQYNIAEPR